MKFSAPRSLTRFLLGFWLASSLLAVRDAVAQTLQRTCLPGDARSQGLDAALDPGGRLHLSRIDRVMGDLLHTVVEPDGTSNDTIVAASISRLAIDEVRDTGLALWNDEPAICFHSTRVSGLVLATHGGAGWLQRTLVSGVDVGRDCALVAVGARLRLVYREAGSLKVADVSGAGFTPLTVDSAPGLVYGQDLAAVADALGQLVIAHHDGQGHLRLTWERSGGFSSAVANAGGAPAGVRPTLVLGADGSVLIDHGGVNPGLDVDTDAGLYETFGPLGGPFQTDPINGDALGGAQAALETATGRVLFARERQRSALFGAWDALWFFSQQQGVLSGEVLEQATPATARHDYGSLRAALDPFGQPVFVYGDMRGASVLGPASEPTCLYRLADTDADAIPDAVETDIGTDPQQADTDGDGALDGEEVLLLGTDPTVPDGCVPSPEACDALDNDCDGETDEALERGCYPGPSGTLDVGTCQGGTQLCGAGLWAACSGAITPAASDSTCDGRDEDCDGAIDDEYVRQSTRCGVGACSAGGLTACIAGRVQDDCRATRPAADDTLCNGIDDDCSGQVDEDFAVGTVTCGRGVCQATGQILCTGGRVVDTCRAGTPAAEDRTCDGLDDDCDGRPDEDFGSVVTFCGAGACTASGHLVCQGGVVIDTCRAGAGDPTDTTCDGVDDDCNGVVDDGFVELPTHCGQGACASVGDTTCRTGVPEDNCRPGPPTGADNDCDGVDDDCDGASDESYVGTALRCGLGACETPGVARCIAGIVAEDCLPTEPTETVDTRCDGLDEDCDGEVDEDFDSTTTMCGEGVCVRAGASVCVEGRELAACAPGQPTGDDRDCDGVDEDCDGVVDDGYVPVNLSCGVGACLRTRPTRCEAGRISATCVPGEPALLDDTCDGVDDDCDGTSDEDVSELPMTCGTGACQVRGARICVDGSSFDACIPGRPGRDDRTCDGLDDDCDGEMDEDFDASTTRCGVGACAGRGVMLCRGGVLTDTCAPALGAPTDTTCDGRDDDCDGTADEDFVVTPTGCGVGACARSGVSACRGGVPTDTCVSGDPPAPSDVTCDGLDDDCDGLVDDDYPGLPTTCGVGACQAAGQMRCVDGRELSVCTPVPPAADDTTCDGRDNNCDGRVDEAYAPVPTRCGAGNCAAEGQTRCVDGRLEDSCRPTAPGLDDNCDGLDDDCDGAADDDFVGRIVDCGAGACAARTRETCVLGRVSSTCVPLPAAPDDADCDGTDDDCDGQIDEDFSPTATTCGMGACAAAGDRICRAGRVVDTCAPGPVRGDDSTCDGIDDDCDGQVDEAYVGPALQCGEGACRAEGRTLCRDGEPVDSCSPASPPGPDSDCNGLDEDCDGQPDNHYVAPVTPCGVGACRQEGRLACVNGALRDTCAPAAAAPSDTRCDGIDDDCDGAADEDYLSERVECAPGSCVSDAPTRCEAGRVVSGCDAPPRGDTDTTCDGLDDDCNGRVDDGFVDEPVTCGLGACGRGGVRACRDGQVLSTCLPGSPAVDDATCDGLDDDCDGELDEDFTSVAIECGEGACRVAGLATCVEGRVEAVCEPPVPAALDDATCDGVDDDCDGEMDEDFDATEVTCGTGACAAVGLRFCDAGRVESVCDPAPALSLRDSTCDGRDDDCDGRADEDFVGGSTACGVGACRAVGRDRCVDGLRSNTCEPRTAALRDDTCNGLDDDCDGEVDEDFAERPSLCGVGACEARGATRCEAGRVADTCTPGLPAEVDATCDRRDDDCDGETDEDVGSVATACGQGACVAAGQRVCESGRLVDHCTPADPTGPDDNCDGVDQDCDGAIDDGFSPTPVFCGEGACGALGATSCVNGFVTEICRPGAPAADDRTCDARDDDCDGHLDEDAPRRATTCGVGACAGRGEAFCAAGEWFDTCVAQPQLGDEDRHCDGIDEDCDGLVDEDCDPAPLGDAGVSDDARVSDDATVSDDAGDPERDAGDPERDAARPPFPDGDVPGPDVGVPGPDAALPSAESDTGAPPQARDGLALPDGFVLGDGFGLPEPTSDAFVIPGTDIIVPDNAEIPRPVVSCDCRTGGGTPARPLAALLFLLAGVARSGLRRRVSPKGSVSARTGS